MGGMLSNVVFQPPPCEYHLKVRSVLRRDRVRERVHVAQDGREYVELKTSLNERIFGVHIDAGHELTVLFSHGNAEGDRLKTWHSCLLWLYIYLVQN